MKIRKRKWDTSSGSGVPVRGPERTTGKYHFLMIIRSSSYCNQCINLVLLNLERVRKKRGTKCFLLLKKKIILIRLVILSTTLFYSTYIYIYISFVLFLLFFYCSGVNIFENRKKKKGKLHLHYQVISLHLETVFLLHPPTKRRAAWASLISFLFLFYFGSLFSDCFFTYLVVAVVLSLLCIQIGGSSQYEASSSIVLAVQHS